MPENKSQRFYDEDPVVKKAVESVFLFPDEVQRIIAKGFEYIAEKDCDARALMNEFRTLGTDRVLSLYKAQKKQRHYDHNPHLHNAMNYLLIMDKKNRRFIATKIIELIGFMHDYFKMCKEYSQAPNNRQVEDLKDVYVEHGAAQARVFINRLDQKFKNILFGIQESGEPAPEKIPEAIEPVAEKAPGSKSLMEGIESESGGMKIKADLI